MEAIYTKTTQKGSKVEFALRRYLDSALLDITVDGKPYESGVRIHEITDRDRKAYGGKLPADICYMAGKVCLLPADVDALIPIIAKAQAEIDAEPAVIMSKAIASRRSILDAIRGWEDEREALVNRNFERGDGSNYFSSPRIDEAKRQAAEARKQLAEFDAAHPEVITEIKRRQAEDVAQHIWD